MNAAEALDAMSTIREQEYRKAYLLDELAKIAFPVGSRVLCTNWRTPVMVTILEVRGRNNIWVRSDTKREYNTSSWCLGADHKRDYMAARTEAQAFISKAQPAQGEEAA